MKTFVVAVPLFDGAMGVRAYRLCDRSGEKALGVKNDYRSVTEAFLSPGLDMVERLGPEPFAGDKPLFVDVNRFQLMTGTPTNLDIAPARLVCVLPAELPPDEDILARCGALQGAGYGLALDGMPKAGPESPLWPFVRHLLLRCTAPDFAAQLAMAQALPGVQLVITGVPDRETYQKCAQTLAQQNRTALFMGDFYSRPITRGTAAISPIKVNALQLLNQVNQQDFELADISHIVQRDPALSISLLKFINSGAVGLQRQVHSIQSAVAILGQQEVRRWATVAISIHLAEDRPSEITKCSLVRAKFAENLAGAFGLGVFGQSLFMAGLFSLLDVILQKPMEQAIREVAVDGRVRQALVERAGPLYPVLELIYTYERADWDKASILIITNNTTVDAVTAAFVDALVWYRDLLRSIDEPAAESAAGRP